MICENCGIEFEAWFDTEWCDDCRIAHELGEINLKDY